MAISLQSQTPRCRNLLVVLPTTRNSAVCIQCSTLHNIAKRQQVTPLGRCRISGLNPPSCVAGRQKSAPAGRHCNSSNPGRHQLMCQRVQDACASKQGADTELEC